MSEFARLLRYAIPGGVFELAVATWVFVAGAYNPAAIKATEPALIALLIAAPLVILALFWLFMFILLCCSEARVARITEAFAVAMIGARWR